MKRKSSKTHIQIIQESLYNTEFVAIIKESSKDKKGKVVTAETLWQDLGL
jgi:hypothetical protein